MSEWQPGFGFANRARQVSAAELHPAVARPAHGGEQRLPPQRVVAVFVAVVHAPPIAGGSFDESSVPARPPHFVSMLRAHERVFRVVLPRAVDRLRAGRDHHVPGGRSGGAAHGGDQVVVLPMAGDLGPFWRETFDVPIVGIAPGIVYMLD